ncbi:MAG TPA: hypothetical protein VFQ60_00330 [Patescibacteria group bacterium]|nr:hypothetical protein [Patescibacteria group bacterium]
MNLIHVPSIPSRAESKESVQIPSKKQDLLCSCEIDKPWETLEEFDKNIHALPKSVRDLILGSTEPPKKAKTGPKSTEIFSEDLEAFFEKEETVQERAERLVQEHPTQVLDALSISGKYFLEAVLWPQQIRERYRRSQQKKETAQFIKDFKFEISEMLSGISAGRAPFISAEELKTWKEGYEKENADLVLRKQALEYRLSAVERKARESKTLHEKRSYHALYVKLYAEFYATYATGYATGNYNVGRLADLGDRAYRNTEELKDLKHQLDWGAEFMEEVMKAMHPKLTPEQIVSLGMDWFGLLPKELQNAALEEALTWYEAHPFEDSKKTEINHQRWIKKLVPIFKEAFWYLHSPQRPSPDTIQHVQHLLRQLLHHLEKAAE